MGKTKTKSPKDTRVVVAMSGGVDSSVAAALMVEQGYDVIGMMMRLWSEPAIGSSAPVNRCCTPDQMADARRIADSLGIPFYVVDVKDYFRQTIVQFFIDEHASGRTPNPCIECNRKIRFDYLLNRARALDADYLATGHYARIRETETGFQLLKGLDPRKDQSYVLHVMGQAELAQVKFPIGEHEKIDVRQMATDLGLPVAQKSDSQDLCFLGDGDYRRFLQQHAPEVSSAGPILTRTGEKLGDHDGLPFYTIGQRKGLGFSAPQPMFVIDKDISQNALIVGTKDEVGRSVLQVRKLNWVAGVAPEMPASTQVKIRYKAKEMPAMLTSATDGLVNVEFDTPLPGITPGQGAVFYDGDICLGGGLIADNNTSNRIDIPLTLVSNLNIPIAERT
jgi:tRNA-specific 2-thiouridylase